jgi:hypothetical protein
MNKKAQRFCFTIIARVKHERLEPDALMFAGINPETLLAMAGVFAALANWRFKYD